MALLACLAANRGVAAMELTVRAHNGADDCDVTGSGSSCVSSVSTSQESHHLV
jgi:hypothetical protein